MIRSTKIHLLTVLKYHRFTYLQYQDSLTCSPAVSQIHLPAVPRFTYLQYCCTIDSLTYSTTDSLTCSTKIPLLTVLQYDRFTYLQYHRFTYLQYKDSLTYIPRFTYLQSCCTIDSLTYSTTDSLTCSTKIPLLTVLQYDRFTYLQYHRFTYLQYKDSLTYSTAILRVENRYRATTAELPSTTDLLTCSTKFHLLTVLQYHRFTYLQYQRFTYLQYQDSLTYSTAVPQIPLPTVPRFTYLQSCSTTDSLTCSPGVPQIYLPAVSRFNYLQYHRS
ncbi:hypothetical protein Ddc_16466 [Ditylenchus destructor]|nr:hypothetical protein Ddc_16466 [Ditylenchus destructor]